MKNIFKTLACSFVLLSLAGTANALMIERTYTDPDGSGVVTYNDLGGNVLEIEIDNTTPTNLDSLITGLVFDIVADINGASYQVFDGDNNDITTFWGIAFNASGNITPGNTEVDLYFDTNQGIEGGIYNGDGGANPNPNPGNAYTDIARIVLDVTDPVPWVLASDGISNDILRMQQTGSDGEGSLKIPGDGGGTPAPIPGTLFLLGLGLIGLARTRVRA